MIVASLHSLFTSRNFWIKPQASRARRPESACRSRLPDGTSGDVAEEGEGRGRWSKMVYFMLFFESRDARVRPAGPAPRIAI